MTDNDKDARIEYLEDVIARVTKILGGNPGDNTISLAYKNVISLAYKVAYDAIPIDAIVLYWRNSCYDVHAANDNGCTTQMFDAADMAIEKWMRSIGK